MLAEIAVESVRFGKDGLRIGRLAGDETLPRTDGGVEGDAADRDLEFVEQRLNGLFAGEPASREASSLRATLFVVGLEVIAEFGDIVEFDGVGHAHLQRFVEEMFLDLRKQFANSADQFVDSHAAAFAGIAPRDEGRVVGHVLGSDFDSKRNSAFDVVPFFVPAAHVAIVDINADRFAAVGLFGELFSEQVAIGKDIGFLPGDIEEKLNPWMQPIYDNVDFLFGNTGAKGRRGAGKGCQELMNQGLLQIEPLTYIRGRSIPNQYLIVDESQNLTPHEIKTIITRAGDDTKIVLTGDSFQIDNPYVDSANNGLVYLVDRFKDQSISAHVTFVKGERSKLSELASNLL
jgi:hypothetical protein